MKTNYIKSDFHLINIENDLISTFENQIQEEQNKIDALKTFL